MDQSDEAKAGAAVLVKVFEGIATKLKAERGLTDEQIGLAMLATGVNSLTKAWSGPEMVERMAGLLGGLMETYGIQPDGEHVPRGRLN